eukprot:CAMPEP_0178997740 /NCGR_PEP_ID=MMETSP0795-20121207/9125_1 /TAXON_ID=88552 /ORGANISM="Amoebophrya sp., Strain Ameob2" /LENGTH=332 /DNA_ID=CAMNT_0020690341 /DNA_START=635 /DNA_END=1632 /DNA_ORIENTATION=+
MRVARYHPPIPAVRFRPVGPERVERDPLAAAVSQEARLILSVRTSQPPFRVAWFFLLRAQQHDPAGVHVRAHVSHLVPEVADRKLEVGAVCSVPRVLMPAGHVVLPHTERGEVHFVPASALRLPLSELADLPQKLPRPRDLELLREILRGRLVLLLHVQVCEMGLDPAEGFPVGARWRNVGPRARREGAQLEVLQDSRDGTASRPLLENAASRCSSFSTSRSRCSFVSCSQTLSRRGNFDVVALDSIWLVALVMGAPSFCSGQDAPFVHTFKTLQPHKEFVLAEVLPPGLLTAVCGTPHTAAGAPRVEGVANRAHFAQGDAGILIEALLRRT